MIQFSIFQFHNCAYYSSLLPLYMNHMNREIEVVEIVKEKNMRSLVYDYDGNVYNVGDHEILVGEFEVA